MMHELLFALRGCPGSLFVKTKDNDIKVLEGLSFLHPSETIILQKLCALGSGYCYLNNFISVKSNPGTGYYLATLCRGIKTTLVEYENLLLELEKECMADLCISLSHFQYKLNDYDIIFPALHSFVDNISTIQAHGCYILDIVYTYSISGVPVVQNTFKRLLSVCHGVLFKQLISWLIYGIITDDYHEFFVQKMDEPSSELDGSKEKNLMPGTFYLKANLLPSYIPHRVANKILFVGESIQLFSQKNSKSSYVSGTSSMFDGNESDFSRQLSEIHKQEEFSVHTFELVLDAIRSTVAEHLWKLAVEESDLIGKLNHVKDYFLLGRGELFLTFIDQINPYLSLPSTSSTEHDANTIFQMAASSVFLDEKIENEVSKFTFKIAKIPTEGGTSSEIPSGWDSIVLEYNVSWPLHIFFSPSVLSQYQTVFRFLLKVKRVQAELHKCWSLQMLDKSVIFHDAKIWQLRNHMSFLVDNLQYYLQADVLEGQFTMLVDRINATRDFEKIQHFHEQFISLIMSQTFLLSKPISHCLNAILILSMSLCKILNNSPVNNWTDEERLSVERLGQEFGCQVALLFKILSSVSHQSSPYLSQFLLRIDYNKFLSNFSAKIGI